MKKSKNKKFFLTKIILFILLSSFFTGVVYWIDVIWDYIKKQSALWKGTNNNQVTFSQQKTTYYINKWDDNILEWNNFVWYYYDHIYWFFRLDWSANNNENIHISSDTVNSTIDWCTEWLKLKWKAYSKNVWFIDFNYSTSNYVYYCKDNDTLYWKSYSNTLWSQTFNWIEIEKIVNNNEINSILDNKWISNDTNRIVEDTNNYSNQNWENLNIWWWDKYTLEEEIKNSNSIKDNVNSFWIIK
jgi:hypothetical protein